MDVVLDMLFTQSIGLMRLFALLFIIGIGLFMAAWITRRMTAPWK